MKTNTNMNETIKSKVVNYIRTHKLNIVLSLATFVILFAVLAGIYIIKGRFDFYMSLKDKVTVLSLIILSSVFPLFKCKLPRPIKWLIEVLLIIGTSMIMFYSFEPLVNGAFDITEAGKRYNIIIIFTVFLFFYGLSANSGVAALLGGLSVFTFYLADFFVFKFRGSPILFSDILSAKTAMGVAGQYSYTLNSSIVILIFELAALCSFAFFVSDNSKKILSRVVIFILCIGTSFGTLSYLTRSSHLTNKGFEISPFLPADSAYTNGLFLNAVVAVHSSLFDEPEGYSNSSVNAIIDKYSTSHNDIVPTVLPNIILVMNESFTDIDYLETVQASEPPIPKFKAMSDNCVKGTLISSILGGNTPNSEFECLTGCSMAFLPTGSIPYQQYITSEIPNLVSSLKNMGYETSAVHIYDPSYFGRNRVYPLLGIDNFINERNYSRDEIVVEYFRSVSGYAADKSSFQLIINEFNKKASNEPFFNFCVTIQNHGGYWTGTKGVYFENYINDYADEYLSLLKITDDAFADLIDYFDSIDEPTIVIMYGDHQPYLFADDYVSIWDGCDYTDAEKRYMQAKTPFVIWANYDIEEYNVGEMSINYLGPLIMKTAGLPMSDYFKYLDNLRETIPVVSAVCFVDKDGNHFTDYKNSEYSETIKEYEYLQYNYLKGNVKKEFYK